MSSWRDRGYRETCPAHRDRAVRVHLAAVVHSEWWDNRGRLSSRRDRGYRETCPVHRDRAV
ncbi:MAG: hypothetical protein P8020_20025, partial [Acidobacteriota bacterium]